MSAHPPLLPTGAEDSAPLLDLSTTITTATPASPTTSKAPSSLPPPLKPQPEPAFNSPRHTTYWLRCARTFLPSAYESGDASRMLFAFFIVSALDLIGLLDEDDDENAERELPAATTKPKKPRITPAEKQGWVEWIYHCQCPGGGFRGFTGTIMDGLPEEEEAPEKGDTGGDEEEGGMGSSRYDLPNLPATFFALCTLLILGDDLERVDRVGCLKWVGRLQRRDGSFGEVLLPLLAEEAAEKEEEEDGGDDGEGRYRIEGGRDLRFCCCAAGVWYILSGGETSADEAKSSQSTFDQAAMIAYIRSCQSYEGGFSEGPYREAHSGLNYCAVAALSFLSMSPEGRGQGSEAGQGRAEEEKKQTERGELAEKYGEEVDLEACVRWMVQRQTDYLDEDDDEEEEDEDGEHDENVHSHHTSQPTTSPTSQFPNPLHAGFNGRTNKVADTCYAFWNVGALSILNRSALIDQTSLRRYLLGKVQHPIGGFGKGVGEPPDVLHAYLGLATLALLGGGGGGGRDGLDLEEVEPTLCISRRAAGRVAGLMWKR